MITSVLLAVGGPVLDEDGDFRACDGVLLDLLHGDGVPATPADLAPARRHAIEAFSPRYDSAAARHFVPDTRFFLAALRAVGARADEAVMVGDRLDNDIYPANILGMKTIRLLTGPFAAQEARTPRDLPDVTIGTLAELPDAVDLIAASSP